jgi:hypothetical protein
MALCDLGITEADNLLPETGTLVLRSSAERPRAVSLLPRIHLAIVRPSMLRADMHEVFAEAKDSPYLVFITGPSRTADIELTVTLGVLRSQVAACVDVDLLTLLRTSWLTTPNHSKQTQPLKIIPGMP